MTRCISYFLRTLNVSFLFLRSWLLWFMACFQHPLISVMILRECMSLISLYWLYYLTFMNNVKKAWELSPIICMEILYLPAKCKKKLEDSNSLTHQWMLSSVDSMHRCSLFTALIQLFKSFYKVYVMINGDIIPVNNANCKMKLEDSNSVTNQWLSSVDSMRRCSLSAALILLFKSFYKVYVMINGEFNLQIDAKEIGR